MTGHVQIPIVRVADQGLGISHLVREGAPPDPHLMGLCGRVFLPASLAEPLGRVCDLCAVVVRPPPAAGPTGFERVVEAVIRQIGLRP